MPWDANIESKYREKVDHYKDLAIELDMSNCDLYENEFLNQFLRVENYVLMLKYLL